MRIIIVLFWKERERRFILPRPSTLNKSAFTYAITKSEFRNDEKSFLSRLRKLDLIDNKHIPIGYLRGGADQRREFIGGIDGQ